MKVNLDINQRNAVYIKEKNVLVVASPGSGKTTVIINRVNHLIEDLKINEGNIIVITFTRAAADNMRNRYKNIFKKERAPFFGTFHGLFYKILLREGYDIKIMDGGKGHAIIKNVLSRYFDDVNDDKVREVMNNISMFKTSLCHIDEFKSTVSKDIFLECLMAGHGINYTRGSMSGDWESSIRIFEQQMICSLFLLRLPVLPEFLQ